MPKILKFRATLALSLLVLGCTFGMAACQEQGVKPEETAKENQLIVDEEHQSPEGAANVTCTIYRQDGDEYKSTVKTIPRSLLEEIRKLAIASQSKTQPELNDFGITKESVRSHVDIMVESAFTLPQSDKPKGSRKFDSLAPELKTIFQYETVAQNALAEITGAMNSAYDCIRITLPGNPKIVLFSRHRQSGMLPWRVHYGDKKWNTYSRQLPVALSKVVSQQSAEYLADDKPDPRFQDVFSKNDEAKGYWPNGFFFQYAIWARDQCQSSEEMKVAKKLSGWPEASKILQLEDAQIYSGESILVQVKVLDPDCIVDRIRFYINRNPDSKKELRQDWNNVITWQKSMEQAAGNSQWLGKWRKARANRSILAMNTLDQTPSYRFNVDRDTVWSNLGIPGKAQYCFRLHQNGEHCRDAFIGEPYKLSLVTDLGPGRGPTARLPKVLRDSLRSTSALRTMENGEQAISERNCAAIDQTGAVIRRSPVPPNYALRADLPTPTADDEPFDYSWPVDFDAEEDLEYLVRNEDDNEEIESVNCRIDTDVLNGTVDKYGKVIIAPQWAQIGPFSNGLATVKDREGKYGYIDTNGKLIVSPGTFDQCENFHEGLAAVGRNRKYGFIDISGKVSIPLSFESVRRFSEGLAPAREGARFGYIDKTGIFKIPPQFGRARHFRDGLAYVQIDGKRAYIDHSGKPIGGRFFDRLARFADDRALFQTATKYGYIDHLGNEVIPAKFSKADSFRDGVANVSINGAEKAIDTSGKLVQRQTAHSDFWEGPAKEGLLRFRKDLKHGYRLGLTDKYGKVVIKPIYDYVGVFADGLCPVQVNERWGAIDKTGKTVIEPQFDELESIFSEKRIAFRKGDQWGVIDNGGKVIVPPRFSHVYPFKNGMAVVQEGIKFGYINPAGELVFKPQFDAAHQFDKTGTARVSMRAHPLEVEELP